jgi:transcriptional regulator with XRE-family HTH domain
MKYDWPKIVEQLCQRPGWTVTSVADYLGVTQGAVSHWKAGTSPVPLEHRIRLAGMAGWDKTTDLLYELLPPKAAEAWREWNDETTKKLAEKLEAKKVARKSKKSNSEPAD